MATKKKGCGFLITALVLLLIGGGIAGFAGLSAFNSGKEFLEKINQGTEFQVPHGAELTVEEDGDITAWLTGKPTDSTDNITITVKNLETGNITSASRPSGSNNFGNKHLIGNFEVEKGQRYYVEAIGLADGRTITLSNIPSSAVLKIVGKGLGAFFGGGAFVFLALIFGIIGLIMFFTSKPASAEPAAAPPASPPAM
jgi:hypothetical protein